MAMSPTFPYVLAAVITAVPATIGSIAAWKSSHQGRRENTDDHAKVQGHLSALDGQLGAVNTSLQKLEIGLVKLDLRFDGVEDKVDRHLGWHRTEAERDLPAALKESSNDRNFPNN
jgi:hypothetical protein